MIIIISDYGSVIWDLQLSIDSIAIERVQHK